jgi:hypothetical protein
MRILLVLVLAGATLWGGYWFAGSRALERSAAAFLAGPGSGLRASHAGLSVSGFPNRFDLTATDIALTDAGGTAGWQAPFLQIFALSYRPNHVIAVWPNEQSITLPGERIAVASTRMEASLVVEPGTDLALDRTAFVARGLALTGASGWSAALAEARVALRQTVGRANHYDLGMALAGFAPDPALRARLDPAGQHPATVEVVSADIELGLDRPLDRHAMGGRPPQPRLIELREARAVWGGMEVRGSGRLDIGADGTPEGRIVLRARDWRAMLGIAVAAGSVTPRVAPTWEGLLAQMDAADGVEGWLELPLVFRRGRMSLGPLPLGPAPRLF